MTTKTVAATPAFKTNYKIMQDGKRYNTKSYATYELARKHACCIVRKTYSSSEGRYPSMSSFGFSVEKIKAC